MAYKQLYFFVEGNDDERFFQKIFAPYFIRQYDNINYIKYAEMKKGKVKAFITSIKKMSADYILQADINSSICIIAKKQKITKEIKNVNDNFIIIAIKEIESWILAGLDLQTSKKLKLEYFKSTDSINKEKFDNLVGNKSKSGINFMIEILENFSIEVAKTKNRSFKYFCDKYLNSY